MLLWVLVYGENPFENVVAAGECKLTFPKRQEAVSEVGSITQNVVPSFKIAQNVIHSFKILSYEIAS